MKKKMIVGIAMAVGMLSVGAISASAAGSCGKCAERQAIQQFTQETSALASSLKAKEIELREQYTYEGIDPSKISQLETEMKELQNQIDAAAQKLGVPACSRS